jgi:uncharacterized protein (DUF1697 family)
MATKQTYVSLLRGINVGGHKRIKMDQLRKSLETLGFEQVKTYIQSGNIVFRTEKASPKVLSSKIQEKILTDFGFPVSVVCRTAQELKAAVENNPFSKERGINLEKLHVMFLSATPTPAALKTLAGLTAAPEQSCCSGKEIYFYLPNGAGESILMKHPLDRILSVITTTRNWRTVNQVSQMCQDCR